MSMQTVTVQTPLDILFVSGPPLSLSLNNWFHMKQIVG